MAENMEQKETKRRSPRSNQKLKLLYLIRIFMENTDKNHDITLQEIIDKLKTNDVTAERKSLYDDIEQLRKFGFRIEKEQYGKTYHYRLTNRDFEQAELKLLVDTVQSSKFITEKKSNELIKKLEKLTSRAGAAELHRQVYVSGRVKSMNKEILRNVDAIHKAIASDMKISFQYFQWNVKKEMEPRRGGKRYEISPWGLTWAEENYYLVGYDSEADKMKHYRVDKMLKIKVIDNRRDGKGVFQRGGMAEYAKKIFGMYGGEERTVELLCENHLAGVMIDRFGQDVKMIRQGEDHFRVIARVAISEQFLGWIFALGEGVRIIGPEEVLENVREMVKRLQGQYGR